MRMGPRVGRRHAGRLMDQRVFDLRRGGTEMSVEQNKATLRRIYDELWNKGNLSVVPELISPDYLYRTPERDVKGPDGFSQMIRLWRTAFPDLSYTVDEVVGEGDKLAVRVSGRGTFKSKLLDYEPTGREVTWTQAIFYRYVDGKCIGAMPFWDSLTFYRQAGIAPPGE